MKKAKRVVTFNFLAPYGMKVSGGRKFNETHILECSTQSAARLWAQTNLSFYFEREFRLVSIDID